MITLSSPLVADLSKGDPILGTAVDGTAISYAKAYSSASAGGFVIKIKYPAPRRETNIDIQDPSYVPCSVGALPVTEQKTARCFGVGESITVAHGPTSYDTSDTYAVADDNKAGRTIQGFSISAAVKQLTKSDSCPGCPYKEFKKFYGYYGSSTYADEYVTAALDGTAANFTTGHGDADFSKYGLDGRREGAKRGSVYLNVYMYVLREFEDTIDNCKDEYISRNIAAADASFHAWDKGVAFYTGSLEGKIGASDGKLLHALADKRCANYKTCGNDGDELEGISKINYLLGDQFDLGQNRINYNNCGALRPIVDRIADLMSVPMIQGTLRYAYKVDVQGGDEKEKAAGAVFMAAVIPRVHACNQEDAAIIYENMKIGAFTTDYKMVKKAFERNYDCMGVNGALVGGLWNSTANAYYEGAEPKKDGSNVLAIGLGSGAAAVALLALCGVFYMRHQQREVQGNSADEQSVLPSDEPNILPSDEPSVIPSDEESSVLSTDEPTTGGSSKGLEIGLGSSAAAVALLAEANEKFAAAVALLTEAAQGQVAQIKQKPMEC